MDLVLRLLRFGAAELVENVCQHNVFGSVLIDDGVGGGSLRRIDGQLLVLRYGAREKKQESGKKKKSRLSSEMDSDIQ